VKRSVLGSVFIAALLLSVPAAAGVDDEDYEQGTKEATISKGATATKKVPWRNSVFEYEHQLSALSFAKSAELRHNPKYSQALSFQPRYYLRDDLSMRMRLDLNIELTTSDTTDTTREWVVSDLLVGASYAPKWMVIPYAKVAVNPYLYLNFPTSKTSRGESMMMALRPGFTLRRKFDLLKGKWLKSVGVNYGFSATKYFHEFATAQLSDEVCGGVTFTDANSPFFDTGCLQSGNRNRSWRIANSLGFSLQVLDKLSVAGSMAFYYYTVYGLSETATVGKTKINHDASTWFVLGANYDLFEWISLSAGVSTFHPQLDNESDYRTPFFNRYTAFYLSMAVPVDKFVAQVQSWTGWGK
jgi:hypothetical protein